MKGRNREEEGEDENKEVEPLHLQAEAAEIPPRGHAAELGLRQEPGARRESEKASFVKRCSTRLPPRAFSCPSPRMARLRIELHQVSRIELLKTPVSARWIPPG